MKENFREEIYGFTVRNWKLNLAGFPQEDSYKIFNGKRKIICVADGVTRDFVDGSVVTKDLEGLLKSLTGKYPKHAQKASQICVKNFILTKSLESANKTIGGYNSKTFENIDYLGNDFAGCTAAGIVEEEGILGYQFIADSGIAILDSNGHLKFRTPNEGPNSKGSIDESVRKKYNSCFNEQKGRVIIRSQYRNNQKEPLAYGVLTGEKTAENYIRKGQENFNEGDIVLVYTDGIGDILFPQNEEIDSKFVYSLLTGNSRSFCQKRISTEGTLVVYQKPINYPSPSSYALMRDQIARCNQDYFGPDH